MDILFLVLGFILLIFGGIATWQGGSMLTLLAGFMWLSYRRDRRHQNAATELHEKVGEKNAGIPR